MAKAAEITCSIPWSCACAATALLMVASALAQEAPNRLPAQIRVDAELIETTAQSIAACARQGPITKDTLTGLLAKGEATRVARPMMTTKSGVEAEVSIEQEHRYPTGYSFRMSSRTNAAGIVSIYGPVVVPKAITNRTSGLSLRICPELDLVSEQIMLDVEAEWVDEPRWHDFGSAFKDAEGKTVEPVMLQPLFTSASVSRSLVMQAGASQLVRVGIGGRGQLLYLILTADLYPAAERADVVAASTPAP